MKARYVKQFNEFKKELESNAELQAEFKENPVEAIKQFSQNPIDTDKWIYRIIVIGLSIAIISIIVGVLILVGKGKIIGDEGVPTILTALGSAAIGAVAGLLVPSPKSTS